MKCFLMKKRGQSVIKKLAVVKENFCQNNDKKGAYEEIYRFFPLSNFLNEEAKTISIIIYQEMLPNQSFSNASLNTNPTSLISLPTHITDLELDNKSINQNLCESFEGLLMKEDLEESTMYSEWSETQRLFGLNSFSQSNCQNQNKQNVKYFTSISNVTDGKNFERTKIKNIEALKQSILKKRSKVAVYRETLLNQPCFTKIPEELKQMVEIAGKIDSYLVQRKSAKYTDNIHNILRTLFIHQEMSSIWSNVKKIIFLTGHHYKVRIDPLKNICLSFGTPKNIKIQLRKQKLRNLIGQYYFSNLNHYHQNGIPQAYVQPIKTSRFYPQNLNIGPQIQSNKLKKNLQILGKNAQNRQELIQRIQEECSLITPAGVQLSSFKTLPNPKQFAQFCDIVIKTYAQKKVSHLYKSTLVQNLRKNSNLNLQKIFFFIKYITEEGLFLQLLMKSNCKIYGLKQNEKNQLIQILKIRSEENNS